MRNRLMTLFYHIPHEVGSKGSGWGSRQKGQSGASTPIAGRPRFTALCEG